MKNKYSNDKLIEKEIEILRNAVDKAEKNTAKKIANSPSIKEIVEIVENFLKKKKLICYGGTAINNILPKYDRFYDKQFDIPDYDFFSTDAINDAKELADLYISNGLNEVEAKSGIHIGTYKIFVNFIPIADITQMDKTIYNSLEKDKIVIDGISYAPPNFLRMSSYLELSRPAGDISRWEKILKRLILLNKHFPLNATDCNIKNFIRKFENKNNKNLDIIYNTLRNSIIKQGLVFFGGYAIYTYSKYLSSQERKFIMKHPDFDVLSEDPELSSKLIVEDLKQNNIKDVTINKKSGIGEIIAPHYEIKIGYDTVLFIYEPLACHSYNTIKINNNSVKIATIDTMLSFYLAFIYANRPYYDNKRILCMSDYLFRVQARNRLKQKGVLKRFSTTCYGKQKTLTTIRAEKAIKFKELKDKKNTEEYEKYFFRYFPKEKKTRKKKTDKTKKKTDKTKKKTDKTKKK